MYLEANPHRGFHILLAMARLKSNNYFVFSSNIDGQFLKSGFNEQKLFESHGYVLWSPRLALLSTDSPQYPCVHAMH